VESRLHSLISRLKRARPYELRLLDHAELWWPSSRCVSREAVWQGSFSPSWVAGRSASCAGWRQIVWSTARCAAPHLRHRGAGRSAYSRATGAQVVECGRSCEPQAGWYERAGQRILAGEGSGARREVRLMSLAGMRALARGWVGSFFAHTLEKHLRVSSSLSSSFDRASWLRDPTRGWRLGAQPRYGPWWPSALRAIDARWEIGGLLSRTSPRPVARTALTPAGGSSARADGWWHWRQSAHFADGYVSRPATRPDRH